MTHLRLYSTSHCHLCEQAETLLKDLSIHYAFNWNSVDIVEDDSLLSRYAIQIPVICEPSIGLEISWPFSTEDIVEKFNLNRT